MPIYGYACKKCEHTLDALQKMADEPLLDCPACGEPTLKRQLSAPRFRLKGKGWYETDFKKDNQRNLADGKDSSDKSDSKSKDKSNDKTDKKTDAKSTKADKPASTTTAKSAAKSADSKSSAA